MLIARSCAKLTPPSPLLLFFSLLLLCAFFSLLLAWFLFCRWPQTTGALMFRRLKATSTARCSCTAKSSMSQKPKLPLHTSTHATVRLLLVSLSVSSCLCRFLFVSFCLVVSLCLSFVPLTHSLAAFRLTLRQLNVLTSEKNAPRGRKGTTASPTRCSCCIIARKAASSARTLFKERSKTETNAHTHTHAHTERDKERDARTQTDRRERERQTKRHTRSSLFCLPGFCFAGGHRQPVL